MSLNSKKIINTTDTINILTELIEQATWSKWLAEEPMMLGESQHHGLASLFEHSIFKNKSKFKLHFWSRILCS